MKITAIKQQAKRRDRYSVFVDGRYAFSLGEAALLDSKLAPGVELSAEELKRLKQLSADDKLYGNALRYAAMRPRSRWEISEYLRRKLAAPEVAEAIMGKLTRVGFVDDLAFARSWTDSRRAVKPTSMRKLQAELRAKRVSDDVINQVLNGSGADEQAALRELIIRKRRQAGYRQDDVRLMQYLARQGFGYDDVRTAMREVAEAEHSG